MNAVSNTAQPSNAVTRRPRSVTVIGYLFVAVGLLGLGYHAVELMPSNHPLEYGVLWVLVLRLLAIVGGVFVLRGANWARWLLLGWLAYHVILSAMHSVPELVVHGALLAGIGYVLLCTQASEYFRTAR